MGLDIYAGTLTRYYSRNWLTSVQKWGLENGFQVNIVRPEGQENTASPEVIYEGVTQWRDNIIKGLGAELSEAPLERGLRHNPLLHRQARLGRGGRAFALHCGEAAGKRGSAYGHQKLRRMGAPDMQGVYVLQDRADLAV